MSQPRVLRRYDFDRSRPMIVEIHAGDCRCDNCVDTSEPVAAAPEAPPRLDSQKIARLALGGFATGHVAAFAIFGPAKAWHVLIAALLGARCDRRQPRD